MLPDQRCAQLVQARGVLPAFHGCSSAAVPVSPAAQAAAWHRLFIRASVCSSLRPLCWHWPDFCLTSPDALPSMDIWSSESHAIGPCLTCAALVREQAATRKLLSQYAIMACGGDGEVALSELKRRLGERVTFERCAVTTIRI